MFIEKPWGYEEIFAKSEHYVGKILFINKGHRLSKQYHEQKDETVFVLEGNLYLYLNDTDDLIILKKGENHRILPCTIHRMEAKDSDVKLIEVSTSQLDDVIRLEDDYGRS